ncbi:MAG: hypothetical protein A2X81_08250 [Desulfobacterales bacterium GWB2_56_26]|nr:MAG: hypothetical protein A2X81_08250 [Desulfobacterales bacterium GWB2_56_26]
MRDLSGSEFFFLVQKTLFFNEPILIYMKSVLQAESHYLEAIAGIECIKGNSSDLEQIKKSLKPFPWEFQCHDFDGVGDFFVAKDISGVQHISWIYFHNHRNRLLALQEGEAEIKFCLTLPAWRGRGIYPRIIQMIVNYLNCKGMQRVFMCVHRDNLASIRGIEKAGFSRVGDIRLRKILGVQVSPRFDTSRVL